MTQPTHSISTEYRDILQILPNLPPPDLEAATMAMAQATPENRAVSGWLSQWQGRSTPQLRHPRLALFAANHGVGALWRAPVAARDAIAPLIRKEGPLIALCAEADCDLRVYEMSLGAPTRHFGVAAAMDRTETVRAISYGMAAVDMGLDILALASCGDGQELAAAVIIAGMNRRSVIDMTRHLGLSLSVAAQLSGAAERAQAMDPCAVLEHFGGPEIAAQLGALISARMAHTPAVVVDWGGLAALCLLDRLDHRAAQHVALAGPAGATPVLPDYLRLDGGNGDGLGIAAARTLLELRVSYGTNASI